jgi:hypothetical protein
MASARGQPVRFSADPVIIYGYTSAHAVDPFKCVRLYPSNIIKNMEDLSHGRLKLSEPLVRCISCGHLASEHGKTGTKPCLAMTGDLLDRHFCPCDELKITAARGLDSLHAA